MEFEDTITLLTSYFPAQLQWLLAHLLQTLFTEPEPGK